MKDKTRVDVEFSVTKDDSCINGKKETSKNGGSNRLGVVAGEVKLLTPDDSSSTLINTPSQHSSPGNSSTCAHTNLPLETSPQTTFNNLPLRKGSQTSEFHSKEQKKDFKCNFESPFKIDDSIRNRLVGNNSKMLHLSPLYTSKSNHMRNNIKGRCLSNQNLSTIPFNDSHQIDALALSPTHHAPSLISKRLRANSPSNLPWSEVKTNHVLDKTKINFEKENTENIVEAKDRISVVLNDKFAMLPEASSKGQSSKALKYFEKPVIKVRNNYDSSTSDDSEAGVKVEAPIVTQKTSIFNLTKSIPFFNKNSQSTPSSSSLNQFKSTTTSSLHKAHKTDATLPVPFFSGDLQKHPRSASASGASGKPKRHSAKYETPSMKRDSMPNMDNPHQPHNPHHPYQPFQRHSVGRNSSWGSFSAKPRFSLLLLLLLSI